MSRSFSKPARKFSGNEQKKSMDNLMNEIKEEQKAIEEKKAREQNDKIKKSYCFVKETSPYKECDNCGRGCRKPYSICGNCKEIERKKEEQKLESLDIKEDEQFKNKWINLFNKHFGEPFRATPPPNGC